MPSALRLAFVRSRERAMPHLKCYCRAAVDGLSVAWFILTSANMSGYAWGSLQLNNTQLFCGHWELGVLFTPRTLTN